MNLTLPWWMSGPELTKLKQAAENWFAQVMEWANWPLTQLDPRTAQSGIVDLIAWQRGIERFSNEPVEMYRLRVFHAYANASDAGSTAGFVAIFQRLQLGYIEQEERLPDKDWDVIVLRVSDSITSQNPEFMNWLIQTYGRTCRRYEWEVITLLTMEATSGAFDWDQQTSIASLPGAS
ncbi:phage tail protein [Bacterioplanoides sp.]|uniref:phage tail protein n=1 Tax=Bacterioplanoides sp. TaxID=2066072 RepID=UPI003B59C669